MKLKLYFLLTFAIAILCACDNKVDKEVVNWNHIIDNTFKSNYSYNLAYTYEGFDGKSINTDYKVDIDKLNKKMYISQFNKEKSANYYFNQNKLYIQVIQDNQVFSDSKWIENDKSKMQSLPLINKNMFEDNIKNITEIKREDNLLTGELIIDGNNESSLKSTKYLIIVDLSNSTIKQIEVINTPKDDNFILNEFVVEFTDFRNILVNL